jgi:hypothetical protein
MPDQILKEVTHLGSTLAELATKQLDTVIKELKGDVGAGRDPKELGESPQRVNAGTLAYNVLQLVSKAGTLLTQLSEYDLVRRNVPVLTLRASNPLTSLPLQAGKAYPYELLIENEGNDELKVSLKAELLEKNLESGELTHGRELEVNGELGSIFASERRRIVVSIPALKEGSYGLSITITQHEGHAGKVIGKKTVMLNVLPFPAQPQP